MEESIAKCHDAFPPVPSAEFVVSLILSTFMQPIRSWAEAKPSLWMILSNALSLRLEFLWSTVFLFAPLVRFAATKSTLKVWLSFESRSLKAIKPVSLNVEFESSITLVESNVSNLGRSFDPSTLMVTVCGAEATPRSS